MPQAPAILEAPTLTPERVLEAWPDDVPLAVLWSAPTPGDRGPSSSRCRWVIFAQPGPARLAHDPAEALELLEATFGAPATRPCGGVPFVGGWVVCLGYDLGRALEPAVDRHPYPADERLGPHARDDRGWPLIVARRCESALVYDRLEGRWWGAGSDSAEMLRRVASAGPVGGSLLSVEALPTDGARAAYIEGVRRVVELIHAGDVYQANLAHRMSWRFAGSPRTLFRRLAGRAGPWYGGYMDWGEGEIERAVCSLSPELLVSVEGKSGVVTTRPMKGTRPGTGDGEELLASGKDRAELAMIVDLARNDLGRVCRPGSVRVEAARELERHAGGGVLQATATVRGVLRPDRTRADLVRAVFPAGSVTGAPKIRAMRIIDRLEPVRRGPYCGALGFVSDCGCAGLNVLIRTGLISGARRGGLVEGTLDYSVGAGIVAESEASAEWEETLVKARAFVEGLGAAGRG